MKYLLNWIFLLCIIPFFISCDEDTQEDPQITQINSFTTEGSDYSTPNGFLQLDDGPLYTNAFYLVFTDGDYIEDNVNGSSFSTGTNNIIALFVRFPGPVVSSESAIPIGNGTFNLADDTGVLTNISTFSDKHIVGGVQYGNPNSGTFYEMDNTGSGTLTISNFNVDYSPSARNGYVECNYSIIDDNGIPITGNYTGTFKIINEF